MTPVELQPPNDPHEFFPWLKIASEKSWENIEINRGIFGFQTQKDTKWLPGLSDEVIANYEREMGFLFPEIYKIFLRHMNGTDKPGINVYGECGEPYRYRTNYYSFSRDLDSVKDTVKWIYDKFEVTPEYIEENQIPHIMPIVAHRCLIMDRCAENLVLSMYGRDTIYYAPSLETFLVDDIFRNGNTAGEEPNVEVKFWLDEYLAFQVNDDI